MQEVLIGLAIFWTLLVIAFARWTNASIARQVAMLTDEQLAEEVMWSQSLGDSTSVYHIEFDRRQHAAALMARTQ